MEAASSLAGLAKVSGVEEALMKAAERDAFWAVRETALQELGQAKGKSLIPFLKKRCADPHSRPRAAALSALGELREPGIAAFLIERFRKEPSYLAQAEALKALGKTGSRAAKSFLKEAEGMPSFRNIIRDAARQALKDLSSE